MRCDECCWSFKPGDEKKLQCRYEVKVSVVKTRMGVQVASPLQPGKNQPVQLHDIVTLFPAVEPDWWCSHFQDGALEVN